MISILMPVFNEASTIDAVLRRILDLPLDLEIVIVDDASTDQPIASLDKFASSNVKIIHHPVNRGKGAAIRTALKVATGDVIVIHDADLEYDPGDLLKMIAPIQEGKAEVVYGVRSLESQKMSMKYGNKLITFITNMIFRQHLRDVETCYKMMRRSIAQSLNLESSRFEIEAEITAKLLSAKHVIHEVPISYSARYDNKKLSPLDGFPTIRALWKYRKWGKNINNP